MILSTTLQDNGTLSLGEPAVLHDVPSESYLRVIEEAVREGGGWQNVDEWHVNTKCNSFTSSRGLVALVNALAPLHDIPVYIIEETEPPARAELPIDPAYSGEPHIG